MAILYSLRPNPSTPRQCDVEVDRTDWHRDTYRGTAKDLIAAGVLHLHELATQKGRAPGKTVFLPNGDPCPPTCHAWREPGYKTVVDWAHGEYVVEITVSREEQQTRRSALKAAKRERREQRVNEELAARGRDLIPARLKHDYHDSFESWEGTKAQLQAAGIGVGIAFPGEPGANKKTARCTCPLGFPVKIKAHFDDTMAAAGVFRATSDYRPEWREVVPVAPGVVRERDLYSTCYVGAANTLVAAGIVPRADLFPGQPGRNTQQCSYRTDLTPCTTANGQSWAFTIRRRGKDRFEVKVPEEQVAKREAEYEQNKAEIDAARAKRKQLRADSLALQQEAASGVEGFREKAERQVELALAVVEGAFNNEEGLYRFDDNVLNELSGAFAAILAAVHTSPVVEHPAAAERLRRHKRTIAARTDAGLQTFLRLVQSRPNSGTWPNNGSS